SSPRVTEWPASVKLAATAKAVFPPPNTVSECTGITGLPPRKIVSSGSCLYSWYASNVWYKGTGTTTSQVLMNWRTTGEYCSCRSRGNEKLCRRLRGHLRQEK